MLLVGTLVPYAGPLTQTQESDDRWTVTRPDGSLLDGWLVCNGIWVSKQHYGALWAALQDTYGADEGRFRIPDLQCRSIVGAGGSEGLAERPFGTATGSESFRHEIGAHHHTWLFGGGGADLHAGGAHHTAVRIANGGDAGMNEGHVNPGAGFITSDNGSTTIRASLPPPAVAMHWLIYYG